MAIVLQDPRNIGYNLGNSLAGGLSALAQNKLNEIAFSKLGIPQREAQGLSLLNPQIQQSILKAYLEGYEPQQNQGSLDALLNSLQGAQQGQQQEQNILQSLNIPNKESSVDFLNNLNQGNLSRLLGKDAGKILSNSLLAPKQPQNVALPSQKVEKQQLKPSQSMAKVEKDLTNLGKKDFLSQVQSGFNRKERLEREREERKEAAKDAREERKLQFKEELSANADTKKLYEDTINQYESAKDSDRRLNRMEKLAREGSVDSPLFLSLLKVASIGGYGLDFSSLLSADSVEFEKLSTDFIKDAKSIFGSRVTDTDLKTFLKTVPTLLQSNDGKLRVIRNLKLANDAKKVKYNALKEVLKETGGKRPRDLAVRINEKAGDQLDLIAEEFANAPVITPQNQKHRPFQFGALEANIDNI